MKIIILFLVSMNNSYGSKKENYGYKEGDMPKSEKNLAREICLPIFVDITDKQLDYVIESVKAELS